MEYIYHFLWILFAVVLIGKGADWLTDSLVPVARKLGISGVSVGLILVSIAVSLPEVLVAIYTATRGYPALTFGVILGSIFCNIGLMSGLSALYRPLHVTRNMILRDGIFSLVVPILVFAVGASGEITRVEGFAFALLFLPYVINVFLLERQKSQEERGQEVKQIEIELALLGFDMGKIKSGIFSFILGIIVLLVGAYIFSNQLISIASNFQINELIIGLTLGAIGPSIPNIIAAHKAARRGMGAVAVSETLGSNIFTLLVTLGITAMLSPITMELQWLRFDLPALLVMSGLLFLFIVTKNRISRVEGGILLGGYLVVLAIQIILGI